MKGEEPEYVQALAVARGKIIYAGSMKEVLKFNTSSTKPYNLEGKTLLPGFVDPHSHISSVGYAATLCNLFP
jgi:predicted amidohydrolase YtcJ